MKRQFIVWIGTLLCTAASLTAQNCDFTLDAGPDTVVCGSGAITLLNASFNGTPLSVNWSPQAGLADPASLATEASVNATTTYLLDVQAISTGNLISNGDFNAGDTGFDTDYIPGTGGGAGLLSNEGQYAIADNAGDTHNQFAGCNDHTPGPGGNMMVVNGSGQPDNVWCQTISIEPNTNYFFSAWATSVVSQNPANLQFSINDNLLGAVFNASPNTCQWQEFTQFWNSGALTSAEICIANVNNSPAGNDFAIDDIRFSRVCAFQDSVTVSVAAPPAPPAVSCSSTTAAIELAWNRVPGASGYQVNVLNAQAGTMTSDTSYQLTGLSPEQEVEFEVVALGEGPCGDGLTTLSCSTEACPELEVSIDGPEAVCEGEEAVYVVRLTGSGGPFNITVDNGQFPFTISDVEAGETEVSFAPQQSFELSITSIVDQSAPNCVFLDFPEPISVAVNSPANAGEGGQAAFCAQTDTRLQLEELATGGDEGGQWAAVSPANIGPAFDAANGTLDVLNLAVGVYTFEYSVESPAGCENSTSTVEVEVLPLPLADAGPDQAITCAQSTVRLGSAGSDMINYEWTVLEGAALPDPQSSMPEAQSAGVYALAVTSLGTGCTARDTVMVEEQVTFPEPRLSTFTDNCFGQDQGIITVDSVSNGQEPFQFSINGENYGSSPQFGNLPPGNYTISVIDDNGCEGSTEVALEAPNALEIQLIAKSNDGSPSINLGDSLLLSVLINQPEENVDSIRWSPQPPGCPGCRDAYVSPDITTAYSVSVTDQSGCTAFANITVFVESRPRYYIPNAFSPNEDGNNDVFYLNTGPEIERVLSLHIMDRWGNTVFQREDFPPNDPAQGWDGLFRGELVPTGIYAFVVELELIGGKVVVENGPLTVVY